MQALEKLAIKDQFLDQQDLDLSADDNYMELTDLSAGREYDSGIYFSNKRRLEAAYERSSDLRVLHSYTQVSEELESRFTRLHTQWKAETGGVSSIQKIVLNPHYLKIIGMGKPVIPFILKSLAQKPDHWFVALSALIDDKPTTPGDTFNEAVAKWINWGFANGYLAI